jgi:hypothetical protein
MDYHAGAPMKLATALTIALFACTTAQAQPFAPKGAKATLTVKYEYTAVGQKKDKYDPAEWRVSRTLTMVVPMSAEAEQALSTMRPMEAAQMASFEKKQAQVASIHKKMEPTMNDMMKIAERCGEDEACIEKAIVAYGTSADPTLAKSLKPEVDEVMKQDGPRYQMWRGLSQTGTYAIDETYSEKIADPGCHDKPNRQCSRAETRKGGGEVPMPAEAKGISNGQLEFDTVKKDLYITLPTPFLPLGYTRHVTSDYDNEKNGSSLETLHNLPGTLQPITVAITGDARKLSGTQTIKSAGKAGESGTLTVSWQFERK